MESKPIYKTAAELGIEQWEHDGLVALVGPLSGGALNFDMGRTDEETDCGTVACIGGWVAINNGFAHGDGKMETCDYVARAKALHELYYPNEDGRGGGWEANSLQAARAIVNFLVTGDPQWGAVMAGGA